MNTKIHTLAALGVAAVFLVALLPTGNADNHTEFGTQVTIGDQDFIETLDQIRTFSAAGRVCFISFGETNVQNFGFYLRPDAETAGNLQRFSVRLNEAQGNAAGTLVLDSHTAERNQPCTSIGTPVIKYGDVNNNGRYDEGDYIWVTTAAAANSNLDASSSGTVVTIRLTATNGGAAGTLVFAQDADYNSYNGNARTGLDTNTRVGVFDADRSGGFTSGDQLYLAAREAVAAAPAAGALVPLYSVRLHGQQGAFGSQVTLDDDDYIETVNERAFHASAFDMACIVQFGDGTNVRDFGFYLNANGAVATNDDVAPNFIRLVENGGNAAGTLVRATDTTENGRNCDLAVAFAAKYADANNNGRYDEGDYVFLTTDVTGGGLTASTANNAWTIRLTSNPGGAAGTLVFAGDSDFTSYSADTASPVFPGGTNWGIFDRDQSRVGGDGQYLTPGDRVYLLRGGAIAAPGGLVPVYSIRVVGDTYGSQVTFGDSDFRPTLEAQASPRVCVTQLGDSQTVSQFGFYLVFGAQNSVPTNAIRLVAVEGNPAGSIVTDAHNTERGQTCATAGSDQFGDNTNLVQVHYADRNNNGRYDEGDSLYLVRSASNTAAVAADTTLRASTSATEYTIRMTESGDKAAGTLVFAGDSDFQSYSNAATEIKAAAVAYFDEDRSTAFTRGDTVYLQPAALGTPALVQLYAVRVTGSLPTGGQPQPTVSPTGSPTATTSPSPTTNETVDPTASPTGGATGTPTGGATGTPTGGATGTPDGDGEGTPGFGLVAVLAAFGLVAVAIRRRF